MANTGGLTITDTLTHVSEGCRLTFDPPFWLGVLRRCGIILSRMAPQISLCRGIYPVGVNTPCDRLAGFKLHANFFHG